MIGVEMKGMESSMKLVRWAQHSTEVRHLDEWIRAPKYEAGARIHISRGMDRDVIVMKYEEYG